MSKAMKQIGNGNANLIQAALIARFAERRGMAMNDAARVWIGRHAKAFRAFYNRKMI